MRKKGIFPQECLDSASRLENTSLPPKEVFYSNLTENALRKNMISLNNFLELYLKLMYSF